VMRWVRPPRQQRSRDKLDRMLKAVEALLDKHDFEDITMAQVARRARVSVGLLYRRFRDKASVLSALYERYLAGLHATTATELSPQRWSGVPIERFVAELVSFTVRFHREQRGLLRSLLTHRGDRLGKHYDAASARSRSGVATVARLLGTRASEIRHPQPRLAGALGYLFVLGAVREKVLFSEGVSRVVTVSDRRLADELTRAFLAYLGLDRREP